MESSFNGDTDMLKHAFLIGTIVTSLAVAASAAPAKPGAAKPGAAKKPAKLTEVNYCPITGEKVEGKGDGSEVVGKYHVKFCCAGCQPAFDKMSKQDKDKKIAEMLKKQAADGKKKAAA